uniref:(northern house mosquito) hypothetical protein n=1 Tax=Culex pipiens TaxID=7175 RepID=A0A8D8L077_CULPI
MVGWRLWEVTTVYGKVGWTLPNCWRRPVPRRMTTPPTRSLSNDPEVCTSVRTVSPAWTRRRSTVTVLRNRPRTRKSKNMERSDTTCTRRTARPAVASRSSSSCLSCLFYLSWRRRVVTIS